MLRAPARPARPSLGPVVLALPLCLAAAASASAENDVPSLAEVASAYGFDAKKTEAMLRGETVGGKLESVSDNELALSMAFLSTRAVPWHTQRTEEATTSDPTMLGFREMEGDGRSALAELVLPDEELDRLVAVSPGNGANFSSDEIARLRAAAEGAGGDPDARRSAVQDAFRSILAGRLAAYRERGLAGLAPYDRGSGRQRSPAPQLERAFGELRATARLGPDTHDFLERFPTEAPPGVTSRFFWVMHDANGRAVVALSHEVFAQENDRLVAIDRRFYVHHTLNSMQAVGVVIPVEEGTAVFYANRTGTDLVTGFGSAVAKGIGRTIMRRELGRLIDAYLEDSEPRP